MDLVERAQKKREEAEKKSSPSLVERAVASSDTKSSGSRGIGRPKKDLGDRLMEAGDKEGDASSADQSVEAEIEETQSLHAPIGQSIGKPGVGPALMPKPTTPPKSSLDSQPASTQPFAQPAQQQKNKQPPQQQVTIDIEGLKAAGYITPDMSTNLLSEEFRIIKRSLVLNAFAKGANKINNGNMILVSSSSPSEGKTFCTINLALSVATEQDVTVLLVDADFSKPDVLNRLGVRAGKGLMDVLDNPSLSVGDCILPTNIPNLRLLPAGRPHNLGTELLASDRMRDITAEMSSRYSDRLIIFDSPPALASSAASVLALHVGQGVFVIESEKTTETQVKESLNLLSGCEHMTLLLNKTRYSGTNTKFATYYGYGGS